MAKETKRFAKIKALRVQSSIEGFRRAGRAWSREAETVPLAEFSEEQIAQLRAEKMLVVTDTETEVEGSAGE
jgi:hypothetical protein